MRIIRCLSKLGTLLGKAAEVSSQLMIVESLLFLGPSAREKVLSELGITHPLWRGLSHEEEPGDNHPQSESGNRA